METAWENLVVERKRQNTTYFHVRASKLQWKNSIVQLRTKSGNWCTEEGDLWAVTLSYFQEIYRSINTRPSDIERY